MPRQYLKINSADRVNPTTTTAARFTIKCDQPIQSLNLKAVLLPVTYYNVSALNNQVYFTDTVDHIVTIPPGYYSSATFRAALIAAMNASSSTIYTCTLNALSQSITVTGTSVFTFTFGSNTANSAAEIMGFIAADTAAATTQTGSMPLNLATTLCYNIVVNNSSCFRGMSSGTSSFVIPALTTTPNMQYYEVPLNMPQAIDFQSTKYLDFAIYDDRHRLLNFTSDWYLIAEAE